MKVDTCVILQKDFTVDKFYGFVWDTQCNDDFKAVEIPGERDTLTL